MKTNLYIVNDIVANKPAGDVFSQSSDIVCIRSLLNNLPDKTQVRQYELYCIGIFDTDTLEIIPEKRRVCGMWQFNDKLEQYLKSQGV